MCLLRNDSWGKLALDWIVYCCYDHHLCDRFRVAFCPTFYLLYSTRIGYICCRTFRRDTLLHDLKNFLLLFLLSHPLHPTATSLCKLHTCSQLGIYLNNTFCYFSVAHYCSINKYPRLSPAQFNHEPLYCSEASEHAQ